MSTENLTPREVSQLLRERLEAGDSAKDLLELSLQETERQKLAVQQFIAKQKQNSEVLISDEGGMVAKSLESLIRIGQYYAERSVCPERFRKRPEDCALGHLMAQRWGLDTLLVLQSLYVYKGTIGIDGKLTAAILNKSPAIKGRVRYLMGEDGNIEGKHIKATGGKNLTCTASVIDAETGQPHSYKVDLRLAEASGWDLPNGSEQSHWAMNPELSLKYRACTYLGRLDYSELLMGFQTSEELADKFKVSVEEVERAADEQLVNSLPASFAVPRGFSDTVGPLPPDADIQPESQLPPPEAESAPPAPVEEPPAPVEEPPAAEAESVEQESAEPTQPMQAGPTPAAAPEDEPVAPREAMETLPKRVAEINARFKLARTLTGLENVHRSALADRYGLLSMTDKEMVGRLYGEHKQRFEEKS